MLHPRAEHKDTSGRFLTMPLLFQAKGPHRSVSALGVLLLQLLKFVSGLSMAIVFLSVRAKHWLTVGGVSFDPLC